MKDDQLFFGRAQEQQNYREINFLNNFLENFLKLMENYHLVLIINQMELAVFISIGCDNCDFCHNCEGRCKQQKFIIILNILLCILSKSYYLN
ncbi:unnamed protein product [Paramecium sonneborni]|uniref:Uncharacterized protein n=1 Tax=Paramecium sonneborni TaxID=65129 RepID=A0A8S1PZK4_9CILI|nr:unnamed protein product [Paramecium sonneborni]